MQLPNYISTSDDRNCKIEILHKYDHVSCDMRADSNTDVILSGCNQCRFDKRKCTNSILRSNSIPIKCWHLDHI